MREESSIAEIVFRSFCVCACVRLQRTTIHITHTHIWLQYIHIFWAGKMSISCSQMSTLQLIHPSSELMSWNFIGYCAFIKVFCVILLLRSFRDQAAFFSPALLSSSRLFFNGILSSLIYVCGITLLLYSCCSFIHSFGCEIF